MNSCTDWPAEPALSPVDLPAPGKDLILMSCSHQSFDDRFIRDKITGEYRQLTALERYDGPWYRTLKAWVKLNGGWPEWLEMYVLTSKYGLLHRDEPCPWYDIKRRTPALLGHLSHQVLPRLAGLPFKDEVKRILYVGGQDSFARILRGIERMFPGATMDWNRGRIGAQCHHMVEWLNAHG